MFSLASRCEGRRWHCPQTRLRISHWSNRSRRRSPGHCLSTSLPRVRIARASPSDITQDTHEDAILDALVPAPPSVESLVDEPNPDPVPVETEEKTLEVDPVDKEATTPFKVGDLVMVSVVNQRKLGAVVSLVDYPGMKAFLPLRLFPMPIIPPTPKPPSERPPEKDVVWRTTRLAMVYDIDSTIKMESGGLVVSAEHYDRRILYRRLHQIRDICKELTQSIKGYVVRRNKGGLVIVAAGLSGFLPRTQCGAEAKTILESSVEDFKKKYKNAEIDVVIHKADLGRVIFSNAAAEGYKVLQGLRIGSLIRGSIRTFTRYGAFVNIAGTYKDALLHIRHISQGLISGPEEVFEIGEEIYALVLDMTSDFSRISLGTSDLEEERGEILYNKERVMHNAPFLAAKLQDELNQAREAHMSGTEHNEHERV